MAITNGYATLVQMKERIGLESADTDHDSYIETLVERISRAIDEEVGRRFYLPVAAETRIYSAMDFDLCMIDDLKDADELTSIKTDTVGDGTYDTTWTTADYVLNPRNAEADGRPYTRIRLGKVGVYTFPTDRDAVQVVAKFGFSDVVPGPITEATEMTIARFWKRKDAVFGVAGKSELGSLEVIQAKVLKDPDIVFLLNPFRRVRIGSV